MQKAKFLANMICEETNVKNFSVELGKDENGNDIKLNYEKESKEWNWRVGSEKKPVKNKEAAEELFLKALCQK